MQADTWLEREDTRHKAGELLFIDSFYLTGYAFTWSVQVASCSSM